MNDPTIIRDGFIRVTGNYFGLVSLKLKAFGVRPRNMNRVPNSFIAEYDSLLSLEKNYLLSNAFITNLNVINILHTAYNAWYPNSPYPYDFQSILALLSPSLVQTLVNSVFFVDQLCTNVVINP